MISMTAVTVKQPYAHMLGIEAKHYEWRSKPTKHRGFIALHAGKDDSLIRKLARQQYRMKESGTWEESSGILVTEVRDAMREWYAKTGRAPWLWDTFPLGAIIGYADLRGCYPYEDFKNLSERERLFGYAQSGMWAWELKHVRLLPTPVPCKGQLGLWRVPDAVSAEISRLDAIEADKKGSSNG